MGTVGPMTKEKRALLSLMLLASGCSLPTSPANRDISQAGACDGELLKAEGKRGGDLISVEGRAYQRDPCLKALAGPFWGEADAPPIRILGTLNIQVGSDSFSAPISSFVDLADPSRIEVATERDGVFVKIFGQGESRYIATLKLEDGRVSERLVTHPGFENEVFERTSYSASVE